MKAYNIGNHYQQQARKGFRPLSAMKGIGYFQNLRNFFKIIWGIFWNCFGIFSVEDFLGGIF